MLNASSRIEHRWGERLHVEFPILITARTGAGVVGARVIGTVVDVSLSGARIRAGLIPRRQALIELSLELPTADGSDGRLTAHVIRRSGDELGIEWAEFAPQVIRHLMKDAGRGRCNAREHGRLTERSL